jgi:hypothetical protein
LTTSFSVPSPPTETTSPAPSRAACSASSIRTWTLGEERRALEPELRCAVRVPASAGRGAAAGRRVDEEDDPVSGTFRCPTPLLCHGRERDARHPVDRRAQPSSVIRVTRLDDDVADGEEAAGVNLLQRPEREEDRSFHLDREDAAVGPALVLPAVRVVEDVARHDRADVHRLAHLLRGVHGAVDEPPVRGRAVRLLDVVQDGAVLRHGRSAMIMSPSL